MHLFVGFVTLVIQVGAMAKFWLLHLSVNVWERIEGKALSTILHSLWERGRANPIFSPNPSWDVS